MSSAPNTSPASGRSTHKSMAVSCTGVDDAVAAGVGGADSSPEGVSSPLLRYTNSPAGSDPWHPNRADRKHFNHLIAEVDAILSAVEGIGAGY
ncbi:hypothetical protein CLAIMM_03177 [Cladophialophora immunda]|nr:hypothetical protein CLAIMM_03177 [Cladophialophora immunda]